MTVDEAIANATRLLTFAEEMTANLTMLDALARLADGWIAIATLIHDNQE